MARYFNRNLKYIRQKEGISQQELASKLNIDRSTISRWENNEMDATVDNARQVADILNISIADLVGKDLTIGKIQEKSELELLVSANKDILTENDKARIKAIIEERKKNIKQ